VRQALGLDRSAAAIAAATPPDRDRYLDMLRTLAIAAVVVGHWLAAVVWIGGGRLQAGTVPDMWSPSHWLTWILQVMPLFFLVGGAVNARSWRSARAAAGTETVDGALRSVRRSAWAAWVAGRSARLLRPTMALVWFWMLFGPLALIAGVDRDLIESAGRIAVVPLWFLAVYMLLIALVPVLLVANERLGLALPAVLLIIAAGIDAVEAAGVPHVGLLNYVVVWSVPTVLGFGWLDGRLERRGARVGLCLGALTGLGVAIAWFDYPISMVGLAGDRLNTPAVTLALLGCLQTGIAVALRTRATRWLDRPAPWAAVARLNMVAMTVYLWHLTVMVLAIGLLHATGSWWSVAPLSAAWWLTRPLWLIGLAVMLAPVVLLLAPIERTTPRQTRTRAAIGVVAVAVISTAAIAELALGGVLGAPAIAAVLGLTFAAAHAGAFRIGVVTP
jgi:hypothetical protein